VPNSDDKNLINSFKSDSWLRRLGSNQRPID